MCADTYTTPTSIPKILCPAVGALQKDCGDGNTKLVATKRGVKLVTTMEVAAGEQLLLGTGLHSNIDMALRFGTTTAPPQLFADDCTVVSLAALYRARDDVAPTEEEDLRQRKELFLQNRGYLCTKDEGLFRVARFETKSLGGGGRRGGRNHAN